MALTFPRGKPPRCGGEFCDGVSPAIPDWLGVPPWMEAAPPPMTFSIKAGEVFQPPSKPSLVGPKGPNGFYVDLGHLWWMEPP